MYFIIYTMYKVYIIYVIKEIMYVFINIYLIHFTVYCIIIIFILYVLFIFLYEILIHYYTHMRAHIISPYFLQSLCISSAFWNILLRWDWICWVSPRVSRLWHLGTHFSRWMRSTSGLRFSWRFYGILSCCGGEDTSKHSASRSELIKLDIPPWGAGQLRTPTTAQIRGHSSWGIGCGSSQLRPELTCLLHLAPLLGWPRFVVDFCFPTVLAPVTQPFPALLSALFTNSSWGFCQKHIKQPNALQTWGTGQVAQLFRSKQN